EEGAVADAHRLPEGERQIDAPLGEPAAHVEDEVGKAAGVAGGAETPSPDQPSQVQRDLRTARHVAISCVRMPRSSTPPHPLPPSPPRGEGGLRGVRSSFTRKLLAWYARAARDLPWRRTRDPYRVLVSEVMLQQTQVARVAEYYPRFLGRFPDLETLASARPKAVREAWDGLGYYARASNLHALARVVRQDFEGRVPDDPAKLVELPGVGPYTAGAVASFAYERAVPAVDTNVARV